MRDAVCHNLRGPKLPAAAAARAPAEVMEGRKGENMRCSHGRKRSGSAWSTRFGETARNGINSEYANSRNEWVPVP